MCALTSSYKTLETSLLHKGNLERDGFQKFAARYSDRIALSYTIKRSCPIIVTRVACTVRELPQERLGSSLYIWDVAITSGVYSFQMFTIHHGIVTA